MIKLSVRCDLCKEEIEYRIAVEDSKLDRNVACVNHDPFNIIRVPGV